MIQPILITESELKNIIKNALNEELTKKRPINEDKKGKKVNEYPNVTKLGDGVYEGIIWGHCFLYKGKKYYSEQGIKNMYPCYFKAIISGNSVKLEPYKDGYQHKDLVSEFED